jgi:hypothetical protein
MTTTATATHVKVTSHTNIDIINILKNITVIDILKKNITIDALKTILLSTDIFFTTPLSFVLLLAH